MARSTTAIQPRWHAPVARHRRFKRSWTRLFASAMTGSFTTIRLSRSVRPRSSGWMLCDFPRSCEPSTLPSGAFLPESMRIRAWQRAGASVDAAGCCESYEAALRTQGGHRLFSLSEGERAFDERGRRSIATISIHFRIPLPVPARALHRMALASAAGPKAGVAPRTAADSSFSCRGGWLRQLTFTSPPIGGVLYPWLCRCSATRTAEFAGCGHRPCAAQIFERVSVARANASRSGRRRVGPRRHGDRRRPRHDPFVWMIAAAACSANTSWSRGENGPANGDPAAAAQGDDTFARASACVWRTRTTDLGCKASRSTAPLGRVGRTRRSTTTVAQEDEAARA